jgi:sterol 24-C-methyltransferase
VLAQVLDVGCGVGGPARRVAEFAGAHVTGINNNAYQLQRAEALTAAQWGPHHNGSCRFLRGDFMDLAPLGRGSFDAAYQIEATCHAPDLGGVLAQIYGALKPGGCFASYEWCLTADYDASNPEHVSISHDILRGNGLPGLRSTQDVLGALKAVGFEVVDARDLAACSPVPWYHPLDCSNSVLTATFSRSGGGFRTSRLGRTVTRAAVTVLETLRIAPKGTCEVSAFLEAGADALVAGGKQGIFTPMFFTLARKPFNAPPGVPNVNGLAAAPAGAGIRGASPLPSGRGGTGGGGRTPRGASPSGRTRAQPAGGDDATPGAVRRSGRKSGAP